jgi:hypothetical protein
MTSAVNTTRHAGQIFLFAREHPFSMFSALFSLNDQSAGSPAARHFYGKLPRKEKSMLTITGITQGKCTWCLEHTEVVTAQFRDGLTGNFCKKHLWQALKVRCESSAPGTAQKTLTPQEERSAT